MTTTTTTTTSTPTTPQPSPPTLSGGEIAIISVSACILFLAALFCCYRWYKREQELQIEKDLKMQAGGEEASPGSSSSANQQHQQVGEPTFIHGHVTLEINQHHPAKEHHHTEEEMENNCGEGGVRTDQGHIVDRAIFAK